MQHGVILFDLDENKMFDLFNFQSEDIRNKMQENFKNKAVTVNELLGRLMTYDEAIDAFQMGFEKGLNIKLQPFKLSEAQLSEIKRIQKERYANDEWNFAK